jgi:hypothetical protein
VNRRTRTVRVRKTTCPRCGGTDLFGPAPVRTSAHPNSSSVLVETPGAHFHDHPLQAIVCLGCGAVDLVLSGPTLEAFREEVRPGPRRRKA